jgi:hypothetical protein
MQPRLSGGPRALAQKLATAGREFAHSKKGSEMANKAMRLVEQQDPDQADAFRAELVMLGYNVTASNPDLRYRTRAAFMLPGRRNWQWVTWTHREPNKHAAIIAKANELGATSWDFGNADHYSLADYPGGLGW